jgi:hypothetical protein
MDWTFAISMTIPLGLAAVILRINHLRSKAKRETRKVGYQREEIIIAPSNVPEFKSTWHKLKQS